MIFSNAVIEHVKNISLFISEIFRHEQSLQKVPPWDHLREKLYPSWAPLNKLKPENYKNAFSENMDIFLFEGKDINHDPGNFEGEKFLIRFLQGIKFLPEPHVL